MQDDEFMRVVDETRSHLNANPEWKARYLSYGQSISSNLSSIMRARRGFREWSALKVYLNTTSAMGARSSVTFELRYLGQTVADLKGNKGRGFKLSTKRYQTANQRDFDCAISLSSADWRGDDSAKFRRFFSDPNRLRNADVKRKNEEHRLESLLLTEFCRKTSKEKPLLGIQPVTIAGVRFPMPTPISASRPPAIKYSGTRGGGIDILARIGTGGRATHLCIMELKINSGKGESRAAMKQATAYATFIRELLRSHAGAAWWKLFGFGGEVPDQLELYAACAMRANEKNETSFGKTELKIDGDIIILHYLYFHLTDEGTNIRVRPGDTTLRII